MGICAQALRNFAVAAVALPTIAAQAETSNTSWATSSPEAQGMRSQPLADMLADLDKYNPGIESITIIRNGHMVLDVYFQPYEKDRTHRIYSCTKSITSALIGIAIQQGHIASVHVPVLNFFPERTFANTDAHKTSMTLEHLLTMTAGMDCRDSWSFGWTGLSDMLDSPDWLQHVLDRTMAEAPGQRFEYCNGASFLLAAILETATGMKALDYARKFLFNPIGISDVSWSTSSKGIAAGFYGIWMKPHDMAKFGWLYLNQGRWNGTQVVPTDWVTKSTKSHVKANAFHYYGYQWWRGQKGIYSAIGHRGQYILVVPKHNLVAVFTGNLKGIDISIPRFILTDEIVTAVASPGPIEENPDQQARIKAFVTKFATPTKDGYVWSTPEGGTAKAGRFIRRAAPAFQLSYPQGSRRLEKLSNSQIMRMRAPSSVGMGASVMNIPAGVKVAEVGPVTYMKILANYGSDLKMVSNVRVILADGTKAYETAFRWYSGGIRLTTFALSVFREGKWVLAEATVFGKSDEARKFVRTLIFEMPR